MAASSHELHGLNIRRGIELRGALDAELAGNLAGFITAATVSFDHGKQFDLDVSGDLYGFTNTQGLRKLSPEPLEAKIHLNDARTDIGDIDIRTRNYGLRGIDYRGFELSHLAVPKFSEIKMYKNIRDKIYVILKEHGKHLHFNEIAEAIKDSEFKRKDVTTQAIHNELIKDKRFVLIGRGIYALKEWGYEKGTVSDIITEVLKAANEPLHRDEIVKRVLKSRFVKETTILLNLQGKPQFKRVAKATYALAE